MRILPQNFGHNFFFQKLDAFPNIRTGRQEKFQKTLILAFEAKCDHPQLHFFRILVHSWNEGNYENFTGDKLKIEF